MTFNPSDHLTKLKGKDYLEAKWRLVWLRDEHPDAMIETQHIELSDEHAIFRAVVTFKEGGGASGYGSETKRDFGDYIEKAETKAIARALAAAGYGTQFTGDEMAEGERIVDSPVQRSAPRSQPTPTRTVNETGGTIAPGVGMTDRQRGFLISLAKELGMVSDNGHHDAAALDAEIKQFCGMTMATLDRGKAKEVIDEFVIRRDVRRGQPSDESHPAVQTAMANNTANWIASMEGAATMAELSRLANEATAAKAMNDYVRAAFNKQRDRLQEKALV